MNASRLAKAFSLRDNVRALFVPRPDAVISVTGFRGMSMLWVLVQHSLQGLRPLAGQPAVAAFLAHPLLSFGWAGNLAIETFFVISGYLIGSMLMEEREANGAVDARSFYVRRAMRIFPAYVFAMGVNLALPSVNKESVWGNLLFVNNFIPFQKQFMAHCWSLAIEEQFFATSPFWIALLYSAKPRLRIPILVGVVGLACFIAVSVVFGNRLELSMRLPNPAQFWRYMDDFYTKPQTRFGSLAIGILAAELERQGRIIAWLDRSPYVGSFLAGLAIAATIYVIRVFPECRGPHGERLAFGALSVALDGYVFGAAISYLLLLSRSQHWFGRAIEGFLGLRIWHVFAQLSFGMYLLHPACIAPLYPWLGFDATHPWLSYLTILVCAVSVSALAGLFVFLFIELPIMRLRPRRPANRPA